MTTSPNCVKRKLLCNSQRHKSNPTNPSNLIVTPRRPLCVKKKLRREAQRRKTGTILASSTSMSSIAVKNSTKKVVTKRKVRGKTIEALQESLQATVASKVDPNPETSYLSSLGSFDIDTSTEEDSDNSPIFKDMDAAWEYYLNPSSEFHNVSNDLEPIPFHLAIKGAPVDADGYAEEPQQVVSSSVAINFSANKPTSSKTKQSMSKSRISKRKKTSGLSVQAVGPKSRQMKVIQRMVIYLQESASTDQNRIYLKVICDIIGLCLRQYASDDGKGRHLPGVIFETTVDRIGGPAFREIFVKSKSFENHSRLRESIETTLRVTKIGKIGKRSANDRDANTAKASIKLEAKEEESCPVQYAMIDADNDFWEWAEDQVDQPFTL